MDFGAVIIAIFGILWLSGALETLAKKVPGKGTKELRAEVEKLREEVQQLRRENHVVVLSFDTTLKQVERRLDYVEGQSALPGARGAGEANPSQPVGRLP
jgi:hypothetical protein